MRKILCVVFVILLTGVGPVLAQTGTRKQNKPVPVTEQARKNQATLDHFGKCHAKARSGGNKPGTETFKLAFNACLQGK